MKKIIFILFSLISIQYVHSQEINCVYFEHSFFGYTCNLHIQNPNGFKNFTHITGIHMQGRSDFDVSYVIPFTSSQSPIFPSIVCLQFVNAQTIQLNNIGLETIDDEAFRFCGNLVSLEIRGNSFTEISENAFAENRNFRDIIFFSGRLGTLPRNLFANQQSLQSLDLQNNQLVTLPDEIFKELRNVEALSLRNNRLTALNPSWFENLQNLAFLDLHNIQLTLLPPNVFNTLENLQFLVLGTNNLMSIHSNSFGTLPRFNSIEINLNQIYSIDERLIDNTALRSVFTGGNPCDTTSGGISDNTASRELIRAALRRCFNNFKENEIVD